MCGAPRSYVTIEQLSEEDLELCVDARPRLAVQKLASNDLIYAPIPCVYNPPVYNVRCSQTLSEMRKIATTTDVRRGGDPSTMFDVLYSRKAVPKYGALCSQCRNTLATRALQERQWIWNSLPEIFGLTVENWPASGPSTG